MGVVLGIVFGAVATLGTIVTVVYLIIDHSSRRAKQRAAAANEETQTLTAPSASRSPSSTPSLTRLGPGRD